MKKLLSELNNVQGVKNVKRRSGPTLRINLFTTEIPGREAEKVKGDLRKISPKIRARLEDAKEKGEIEVWNWIQKPEKQYCQTGIDTEKVSDRKAIGHKPAYYTVSIQE